MTHLRVRGDLKAVVLRAPKNSGLLTVETVVSFLQNLSNRRNLIPSTLRTDKNLSFICRQGNIHHPAFNYDLVEASYGNRGDTKYVGEKQLARGERKTE